MTFKCSDCTNRTLCQPCADDFGRAIEESVYVPANIVLGEE